MKALLYKVGGIVLDVTPADGQPFSLEQLYKMLECDMVEFLTFPDGRVMIGDEEARLKQNAKHNTVAELEWARAWPQEKYPLNNDGSVFGNVLICDNYPSI